MCANETKTVPDSLESKIDEAHAQTSFDALAFIEGAKAISETLDLGGDERPNQIIRLLNKAQQGIHELQAILEKSSMALTKQSPGKNQADQVRG